MVNAYRPLKLVELAALAGLPDLADHDEIIRFCGVLTKDDNTVYFIHQSAKDYLVEDTGSDSENILSKIFPGGHARGHESMVMHSLRSMGSVLWRNIYELDSPGFRISKLRVPYDDPLRSIRYACVYWVDHLCAMI